MKELLERIESSPDNSLWDSLYYSGLLHLSRAAHLPFMSSTHEASQLRNWQERAFHYTTAITNDSWKHKILNEICLLLQRLAPYWLTQCPYCALSIPTTYQRGDRIVHNLYSLQRGLPLLSNTCKGGFAGSLDDNIDTDFQFSSTVCSKTNINQLEVTMPFHSLKNKSLPFLENSYGNGEHAKLNCLHDTFVPHELSSYPRISLSSVTSLNIFKSSKIHILSTFSTSHTAHCECYWLLVSVETPSWWEQPCVNNTVRLVNLLGTTALQFRSKLQSLICTLTIPILSNLFFHTSSKSIPSTSISLHPLQLEPLNISSLKKIGESPGPFF